MIEFKVSTNNNGYEEILAYNQVLNHIQRNEDSDIVWKFKPITAHQGPRKPGDKNYKDSKYNVGMTTKTNDPTVYRGIHQVHIVYAVKHDGRHKARLVIDGHLTDITMESVYSGVISLKGFHLVPFLAELNGLQMRATDTGNAYVEARTKENLVIIAGPEFGELGRHLLIIRKALCGLHTNGLRWHERFCGCLQDLGVFPYRTESDIWMQPNGDFYEHDTICTNDLAIAMRNPQALVDALELKSKLRQRGTDPIDYHPGMVFTKEKGITLCFTPKKYILKVTTSYTCMFGNPSILDHAGAGGVHPAAVQDPAADRRQRAAHRQVPALRLHHEHHVGAADRLHRQLELPHAAHAPHGQVDAPHFPLLPAQAAADEEARPRRQVRQDLPRQGGVGGVQVEHEPDGAAALRRRRWRCDGEQA